MSNCALQPSLFLDLPPSGFFVCPPAAFRPSNLTLEPSVSFLVVVLSFWNKVVRLDWKGANTKINRQDIMRWVRNFITYLPFWDN